MTNPETAVSAAEPYFDDLAELYERFAHVRDSATSPVRSWLTAQLSTGARAIDVGCGGGNNCGLLAERYDEVVGVDISRKMLDIARTKTTRVPVRYECRSATDLTPDQENGTMIWVPLASASTAACNPASSSAGWIPKIGRASCRERV